MCSLLQLLSETANNISILQMMDIRSMTFKWLLKVIWQIRISGIWALVSYNPGKFSPLQSSSRDELAIQWLIFYWIGFEILLLACRKLSGQHECTGLREWAGAFESKERQWNGCEGKTNVSFACFHLVLPSTGQQIWILNLAFQFFSLNSSGLMVLEEIWDHWKVFAILGWALVV